jgi:hypothetical protein
MFILLVWCCDLSVSNILMFKVAFSLFCIQVVKP